MRTCANVAHGLGRGGGHEPLPEAGEFVCDCYENGKGEPWAHVGSSHVHERVVRCGDCAHCEKGRDGWHVCNRWNEPLIFADGDGFCAWGERRAQ